MFRKREDIKKEAPYEINNPLKRGKWVARRLRLLNDAVFEGLPTVWTLFSSKW